MNYKKYIYPREKNNWELFGTPLRIRDMNRNKMKGDSNEK